MACFTLTPAARSALAAFIENGWDNHPYATAEDYASLDAVLAEIDAGPGAIEITVMPKSEL